MFWQHSLLKTVATLYRNDAASVVAINCIETFYARIGRQPAYKIRTTSKRAALRRTSKILDEYIRKSKLYLQFDIFNWISKQ